MIRLEVFRCLIVLPNSTCVVASRETYLYTLPIVFLWLAATLTYSFATPLGWFDCRHCRACDRASSHIRGHELLE